MQGCVTVYRPQTGILVELFVASDLDLVMRGIPQDALGVCGVARILGIRARITRPVNRKCAGRKLANDPKPDI